MIRSKLSYLNFILTVIAVALTAIILQNADLIPKARAAGNFYGLSLNEKGELPVRVMNSDMDVRVNNKVKVNIEEVNGYSVYSAIPVEIKK